MPNPEELSPSREFLDFQRETYQKIPLKQKKQNSISIVSEVCNINFPADFNEEINRNSQIKKPKIKIVRLHKKEHENSTIFSQNPNPIPSNQSYF